MVHLDVTETSKALAVTGGYITIAGLVSFFLKEKLFLSEALLAFAIGIAFGPIGAGIFSPIDWVGGHEEELHTLTFQLTRVVIGIQVLFTGIALPKAYLWREKLSLTTLLFPVMTSAWFVTSLLIWGLIPGLTFLECLVIGACVTPTDPVLSNAICKGRFAEKHLPKTVRDIIVAEAGANDGLGFPFLFLPLYLILIHEPSHPWHTVGGAIGEWFYNIILYQVVLSVLIGSVIGYIARKVLRYAQEKRLIDHESFLSFGVALTLFTLGVVGILGSDDLLCCFAVGNSFTWDDWFRVETEDHSFQDVIDQLLNSAIFLYIGAIMPWHEFGNFWGITPWRLVVLGLLVILVRRMPWVLLLSHFIPALPTWKDAAFAGYFGPMGVGAIYYTQVAIEKIPDDDTRTRLRAVVQPIVYFLVMTSIIVHGITIPLGKSLNSARTLTITRSSGATSADLVSRLPPAVPYGAQSSGAIIMSHSRDASELDGSKRPEHVTISAEDRVRFDLGTKTSDSATISRAGSAIGIQWSDRVSNAGSGRATPVESIRESIRESDTVVERDSTPEQMEEGGARRRREDSPV